MSIEAYVCVLVLGKLCYMPRCFRAGSQLVGDHGRERLSRYSRVDIPSSADSVQKFGR